MGKCAASYEAARLSEDAMHIWQRRAGLAEHTLGRIGSEHRAEQHAVQKQHEELRHQEAIAWRLQAEKVRLQVQQERISALQESSAKAQVGHELNDWILMSLDEANRSAHAPRDEF